ncbi:hypothetical protein I551_4458 [Mycobacterium ulcerans str. Harvey]|uniref:SCP domain-containing protein n=1 Tax=Mycobacterium ulcerans str. Harvey TaxID=1299332 RepID=A0ABN0QWE7_MYCUL|nr:hypothetical protein I551_4458 [Mycobacterium ulcerans str. Harvey]
MPGAALGMPAARADNKRLNDGVVANVYTVQHQAGCTNDVRINPQLQLAAQWHTLDVLNNRDLGGGIGSDGSAPSDRASAAGFHGQVAETVAINPALAISGVELLNQWYYNPAYFAIMSDCANTEIGCGQRTARIARSWWLCTDSSTARWRHHRLQRQPSRRHRWLCPRTFRSTPALTTMPATRSNTGSIGFPGFCAASTRRPPCHPNRLGVQHLQKLTRTSAHGCRTGANVGSRVTPPVAGSSPPSSAAARLARAKEIDRVGHQVVGRELVVRGHIILYVTHHLGVTLTATDLAADPVSVADRVIVRKIVVAPHHHVVDVFHFWSRRGICSRGHTHGDRAQGNCGGCQGNRPTAMRHGCHPIQQRPADKQDLAGQFGADHPGRWRTRPQRSPPCLAPRGSMRSRKRSAR